MKGHLNKSSISQYTLRLEVDKHIAKPLGVTEGVAYLSRTSRRPTLAVSSYALQSVGIKSHEVITLVIAAVFCCRCIAGSIETSPTRRMGWIDLGDISKTEARK